MADDDLSPCPQCHRMFALEVLIQHAAECRRAVVQARAVRLQASGQAYDQALILFLTTGNPDHGVYAPMSCILDDELYLGSVCDFCVIWYLGSGCWCDLFCAWCCLFLCGRTGKWLSCVPLVLRASLGAACR
jgi:hypothetical protein